jgi:hypothetical protein
MQKGNTSRVMVGSKSVLIRWQHQYQKLWVASNSFSTETFTPYDDPLYWNLQ